MTDKFLLDLKSTLRPHLKKWVPSKNFWLWYVWTLTSIKKPLNFASRVPYLNRQFLAFSKLLKNCHRVTYRGVICRKFPTDYVALQMLLWEVKPDLVIEIGTNHGGSALLISDTLKSIGSNYKIHTIDIENYVTSNLIMQDQNIIRFLGGFENYELKSAEGFTRVLVIDDGSHLFEDVLASLMKFSTIVSNNSFFVVEDGGVNYVGWKKQYRGGPLRAISKFLEQNNDFEIDRKFENLFGQRTSNNPNGYLRKVK
jgi:cephalosporin hydroxylase